MTQGQFTGLTPDGWAVMLISVGFVTTFLIVCLWKVMTSAPPDVGDEPEEVEAYRRDAGIGGRDVR